MNRFIRIKKATLWQYFVLSVMGILLLTAAIIYIIVLFSINTDFFSRLEINLSFTIITVLFLSVIIGTTISSLVGKRLLFPITKLNLAAKEIANGNFDVNLHSDSQIKEIDDTIKNFNQMANDLSSIELMRNDFIVNISHEFKTPIAAIEGYAVLLQEKNLPDEERLLYTQMILDSARQFSILSSNILKLSKLENQDKITELANYRLDEQIRNALLYLEKSWTDKDISLELELPKTMLYADEDLMMQVWLNLLSNSIKFTPTNGLIRINIVNKENFIQLHISDTGIGMSSETQKHIFEKFYQGDKSRSIEGNGLGLALVYKILMLHNGKIEVKSELNNGSEFIVTIPQI